MQLSSGSAAGPDYRELTFPPAPPGRPYIVTNMVSSADGKVVVEGDEGGLGSPTDRRLMRELRSHADVVLNGAGTLRVSGSSSRLGVPELEERRIRRGREPLPVAAVLSSTGDLPLDRDFFRARDFRAVVYLSDAAPPSAGRLSRRPAARSRCCPPGIRSPRWCATCASRSGRSSCWSRAGPG